jgi:hypothetical protein
VHRVGPYSRARGLETLDGRSREGRLVRAVRRELTAHVGGRPSATQKALIERAAWLSLRISQLDAKMADGQAFTDHDHRFYLAWVGTLSRTLRQLGMQPAKASAPARSLADYLAERAAAQQ